MCAMTQSTKNKAKPQLTGLSREEVLQSREKYGSNLFTKRKRKSFLIRYLESFGDPIIQILMAALALAVVLILASLVLTKESSELGTRYSQNIYVGHLTLTVKALAMLPVACAARIFKSVGRAEEALEADLG